MNWKKPIALLLALTLTLGSALSCPVHADELPEPEEITAASEAEPSASPEATPIPEPSEVPTPSPEPSAEPSPEPTPVPDGLNKLDGVWYYYKDGAVDESFTGLHKQFGTWFYIENGLLNWDYTGLVKDFGTWFYVENGVINWNYSGLVKEFGTWFYVDKGILNWQFTGLTKQFGTWFYVERSVLDWKTTGLVKDFGTWFYVDKSVLNWKKTGLVQHEGSWVYVRRSVLDWSYTGLAERDGVLYYVKDSTVDMSFSGTVKYGGKWYTVKKGVASLSVIGKTTEDVNLRKGAGTSYDVIDVVSMGTTLTLLEKTNSKWFKVELDSGRTGYVWAEYIEVTQGDVETIKKPELDVSKLTTAEKKAKNVLDTVGWDLRAAFNWSAKQLPYKKLSYDAADGHVHSEWYANYGFDNMCGNCYVMASTFYKMAKLLGCDAYFVEGYVATSGGGKSPHGWCEIEMDGAVYVFDPDFQHEIGRNGYKITYGASGTWKYIDYKRVD